jgi:hypothetical protein
VIVEVGLDGLEVRHASRDDSSSVSCITELEIPTYTPFSCFCSWMRLTANVSRIGGGLPVFPGSHRFTCWGFTAGRVRVHVSSTKWGEEVTGAYLLWGRGDGGRRSGNHCFFGGRGGFGGVVPLSPPDFLEAWILIWLLCRLSCSGAGLQEGLKLF